MSSQQQLLRGIQEEGLLHVAGRVSARQVESLEVVPVGLDLGTDLDVVAQGLHHRLYLPLDRREDVQAPEPRWGSRKGDVDRLGVADAVQALPFQGGGAVGDGRL